jgi:hypothetical protein
VTSSRTSSKIHDNIFIMSMWLDGRTNILEYAKIHFSLVLSYQWFILLRITPFNRKMRFKDNIMTQTR